MVIFPVIGPANVVCREKPIDLVFLVDGSDSIDSDDFTLVKDWIVAVIDSFEPMDRNPYLHVDVVQYSEISNIELHGLVDESMNYRNEITSIAQYKSGTKTYTALQFVVDQVVPMMRNGAYSILVTMTDGDANDVRNQATIDEANELFNVMVGIGVGEKANMDQVNDFSSNRQGIAVNNFDALGGLVEKIMQESCATIVEAARGRQSLSSALFNS